MSTLLYARMTAAREEGTPGTTDETKPGVKKFADGLAALVPAEVLAAHAVILASASEAGEDDSLQTTITDPATLEWAFWALLGASVVIYLLGKAKSFDRWDVVRMLIPGAAFVGWSMLEPVSAFDVVFHDVSETAKVAIAVIGAVVLGVLAAKLAYKADEMKPTT